MRSGWSALQDSTHRGIAPSTAPTAPPHPNPILPTCVVLHNEQAAGGAGHRAYGCQHSCSGGRLGMAGGPGARQGESGAVGSGTWTHRFRRAQLLSARPSPNCYQLRIPSPSRLPARLGSLSPIPPPPALLPSPRTRLHTRLQPACLHPRSPHGRARGHSRRLVGGARRGKGNA